MKKVILYLFLLIVLLLTIAGVWAYFEFLYTKPLSKTELAELTPDWEVVTQGNWSPWFIEADGTKTWNPAASFNAWLATVPEEDKAWRMLAWAAYEHEVLLANDVLGTLSDSAEEIERLNQVVFGQEVDQLIEVLAEAFGRPVMGCELRTTTDPVSHEAMLAHGYEDRYWSENIQDDDLLLNTLVPALFTVRSFVPLLKSRAAMELQTEKPDDFLRTVELLLASSDFYRELPLMINQLVSVDIQRDAFDLIEWGFIHHGSQFGEEETLALLKVVEKYRRFDVIPEGELLISHDWVRRMANANGELERTRAWNFVQSFTKDSPSAGKACNLPASRLVPEFQRPILDLNNAMQDVYQSSQIPWDGMAKSTDEVVMDQLDGYHFLVKLAMGIVWPATDKFSAKIRNHHQQVDGLYLALMLHQYQLQHGAFPNSLDLLETDSDSMFPVDAFTGEPLKYRLTEAGPLIYSVGDDRDDDGGVPTMQCRWSPETENQIIAGLGVLQTPLWLPKQALDSLSEQDRSIVNGDWVLYPTHREEPEPIEDDELDEAVEDD